MTITTFRSLAKHLLRKYVTEELEAFLLSPTPLGNITFLYSIAFKLIFLTKQLFVLKSSLLQKRRLCHEKFHSHFLIYFIVPLTFWNLGLCSIPS